MTNVRGLHTRNTEFAPRFLDTLAAVLVEQILVDDFVVELQRFEILQRLPIVEGLL